MDQTIEFKTLVDIEKCTGCKTCVSVCPGLCFEIQDVNGKKKAAVVNQQNCYGCRACVIHCKDLAVYVAEPESYYL